MLKEAYEYGQRLAAAEKGYQDIEAFKKEAGGLLSVGRSAWNVGSRGALGGAAVGAAGNMAFGDTNQGLLERGAKGALGGAAVGGALGGAAGAIGQKMYRNHLGAGYRQMLQGGVEKGVARGRMADQVRTHGGAFYSQAMKGPQKALGQAGDWFQGAKNKMWGSPSLANPTQGRLPGM